jgi:hypothetical protein
MNQEYIKSLFTYDKETGDFRWKVARGRNVKVGQLAGSYNGNGYFAVKIDYKNYLVHRLIWLYETGEMPKTCIDHMNRIKNDNRFCNLREASYSDNCQNIDIPKHNRSGHIGVSWFKKRNAWTVYVKVNKKNKWLGNYKDLDKAIEARRAGERKYYNLPQLV